MNYLILINNAPDYREYFINLGAELKQRGHNIYYALDSRLTDYLYKEHRIDNDVKIYFSDYFKTHYKTPLFAELESIPRNKILFADKERFYFYPIHKDKLHDYWESLNVNLLNFFFEALTKYKIDVVLYENVSNAFAYSAYLICQQMNKKYIGLASSRLPYDLFEIHTEIDVSSSVVAAPLNLSDERVQILNDYVLRVKNKSAQPAYMIGNTTSVKTNYLKRYFSMAKLNKFFKLIDYLIKERNEIFYNFQNGNPLLLSIYYAKRNLLRRIRLGFLQRYICASNKSDKFFLYPLHFHPEASTSVLSPDYIDEISLIRKISLSMPNGVFLYVKEHPNAFGYNTIDFYQQLKMLSNVKLIGYSENTFDLIIRSIAVVTLTSTVGYEALLYNKPVIVFGDVFYKRFPGCYFFDRFASLEELFTTLLLESQLKKDQGSEVNIAIIQQYLAFVVDGNLFINEKAEIEKVITSIEGFLGCKA